MKYKGWQKIARQERVGRAYGDKSLTKEPVRSLNLKLRRNLVPLVQKRRGGHP